MSILNSIVQLTKRSEASVKNALDGLGFVPTQAELDLIKPLFNKIKQVNGTVHYARCDDQKSTSLDEAENIIRGLYVNNSTAKWECFTDGIFTHTGNDLKGTESVMHYNVQNYNYFMQIDKKGTTVIKRTITLRTFRMKKLLDLLLNNQVSG